MKNDLKNFKSKSEGTTPSERYLAQLCRRSFLSLWSYPNLYTDEGRKAGKGVGRELCDLLVVFENDVVIFSIKHIKFNLLVDPLIAWRRWFRKAVMRSANQLYGAETWLDRFPNRVFLDPLCQEKLPVELPLSEHKRIHRIVIALGVFKACKEFYGGNSLGSLIIVSDLKNESHLKKPFKIGHVNPEKGFVHVLDDFAFDVVLRELDTVRDLVEYLLKRENLLCKGNPSIIAAGEEQLLSRYITKINEAGEHDFNLPEGHNGIFLDEGSWESMVESQEYLRKKQEDQNSYIWDRLIEHFIKYGRGYDISGNNQVSNLGLERTLRLMASEPRLRRRQLGNSLIDMLEKREGRTRLIYSNDFPDIAYLFLTSPQFENEDNGQYLRRRKEMLLAYCKVAKLVTPNIKDIVGFATEILGTPGASEDLIHLDLSEWTSDLEEEAKMLQREYNLFLNKNGSSD